MECYEKKTCEMLWKYDMLATMHWEVATRNFDHKRETLKHNI
jgi:hypothetical protein